MSKYDTDTFNNKVRNRIDRWPYWENIRLCLKEGEGLSALSTTEAENISLSQSTRDLLPIKNTFDLLNRFICISNKEINTCSTMLKDNASAL